MQIRDLARRRFWKEAFGAAKNQIDGNAKLREAALIEYCQARVLDSQLYEVAQYREAFQTPGWEKHNQEHKDRIRIALENYVAAGGVVLDRELFCWVPDDFTLGTHTIEERLKEEFGSSVYTMIDADTIIVNYTHHIEGKLTVLFDTDYSDLEYELETSGDPEPADMPSTLWDAAEKYLTDRGIAHEVGDFGDVRPTWTEEEVAQRMELLYRDIDRTGLPLLTIVNMITKHFVGNDMGAVILPVANVSEDDES